MLNNYQPWKKKDAEDCFDVTLGSYDRAEICELVWISILSCLPTIIDKNDWGLYTDNGLYIYILYICKWAIYNELYIYKSWNHPPKIIKQLPKFISSRLLKNSSNEEAFNKSKWEYENALK